MQAAWKAFWPSPWLRWGLGGLCCAAAGLFVSYAWRVFYYLDSRGIPAVPFTALVTGLFLLAWTAAFCISRLQSFAARGALTVFLAGLVFVFALPPLQAPDETQHYLRAAALSLGRFDFDASRSYPEDVSLLVESFPGAWVNAHTSEGLVSDPDTGLEEVYSTKGYALKQRGEGGRVESVADSFAAYRAGGRAAAAATEPVLFLLLPFVPQALGMLAARCLGQGALGMLYAARAANLFVYALLAFAALRAARRAGPAFLAVLLLPLSLSLAGSVSYDAALLGCYALMAALVLGGPFTGRRAAAFLAALWWVNLAKPMLNLLWLLLPLLAVGGAWQAALRRRWFFLLGLAGALAVTQLTTWYGVAFRRGYGVIGRMLDGVDQVPQLRFLLANPLRYLAALAGSFYENGLFVGQLGLFGALDLPVELLNQTGWLALALGAVLAAAGGYRPRRGLGALGSLWALGYAGAAATAMYITYTPVGMVRIVGLQARYFLPCFLLLSLAGAGSLSRLTTARAEKEAAAQAAALWAFGGYAALGGLVLFQHYFIGPVYTIG